MTDRQAPISWRPSPEAADALAKLIADGKNRGQAINEAIIAAARGPEINADNDRLTKMAPVKTDKRRFKPLTTADINPEKIAAFQRKTGMTAYDKRRTK